MSKVEIVMRLLSAEARVPLHVLRSGQLSDDDWTKLARRMGEISEAPLYVDDTPNMNLMEIRAKARRLKQRHDLKLIVVDYLQLMTSPKRTESRQQEVADLSRGLKLLAKEVECPVVAVSQLNRGPEQRTDKRPQLSDLRESGCLTAATRVTRADTNEEVSLGDLLASNSTNIPVWALDERLKYVPRTMTHVFPSGRRPVFRMTLTSGRQLEATANHPFLTIEGWKPLDQLMVGSRLAVPRHVPGPLEPVEWPDDEVILLARLLGDGSFVARRDEGDVFGLRSHEKFIPGAVMGLSKRQIRLFLRHLWATDGSVTLDGHGGGRVYYTSTSRRLIEGVASLLLRFGITCRITTVSAAKHRAQHTLEISGRDDQLRFLREIGAHGERGATCLRLVEALEAVRGNSHVDTIPKEIWGRVKSILVEQDMSHRPVSTAPETRFRGGTLSKPAPSRARLARVAAVLDTAKLDLLATNDVLWDEIKAIEAIGEQDVFDATVLGHHNFIANGIAVHNSIEQDADVVILLHRDDYYDKESPRAGEADFIVAKHRNGPTDTVTVAAQLHLSRFVDMAI
jgi:replicative DNA helicase